ncbi:cellulose binding domain-containing protein [Dictyobacter arantiisoli]|uniref:CBM2 domain-containing protein n=1 Tax=Dictyobacter arantiisoli TaxID=2014874 RepID=A0A5A5TG85_9CHLR|nr:cellulose binding domain-containing protein [Dictyobacter arantiisoli]GCF10235.1 hypothetical protein KDI_37990 [Dictyobacter arantiisoli]
MMKQHHRRRPVVFSVLIGIALLSVVINVSFFQQRASAASAVTINGATTYQTMDGFGFSEAFGQAGSLQNLSSSEQKQILDLLYSPTTGAGFTILRNLLPSASGSTIEPNSPGNPGATPTYRWDGSSEGQIWMSQQAKNYGVTQLYGDAWSAPGYMKTNGNEANGGTLCGAPGASSCSTGDWRQAYANYLVQYAKDYQSAGVPLTELGAFNELNYTTNYSSMIMNPTQAADFIGTLGSAVRGAGLSPKIVCCDVLGWSSAQSYATGLENNAAANSSFSIFSSHGYAGGPTFPITGLGSHHAWETEWSTFDNFDSAWDDGSDASGLTWAQNISTGLTSANLSAFLYWWGASNGTDNEQLVQFNGTTVVPTGRLWAFANYSRFIRPGAVRIGASSGDNNLQVSAYKNTNGTTSIVVLNTANNAITASYSLQNLGVANGTTVTPYLTNNSSHTAQQASTSVNGGSFSTTIPARSLVTYVLSGTGGTTPTPTPTQGATPTPTPTQGVTPTPTPTSTPVSGASCSVHYAVTNQWQGGFGASLTITNTGSTAINGWSLKFSFPNGQTITQLWNGTVTQSGSAVTISNDSYNGSIPAGGTLNSPPGFNGSWAGSNGSPTAFTLNGAACSVV